MNSKRLRQHAQALRMSEPDGVPALREELDLSLIANQEAILNCQSSAKEK